MVKGVNRRIIEINETDNEMFEKIVLYVRPKYSRRPTKYLKRSADELVNDYDLIKKLNVPLRKAAKKRRMLTALIITLGILAAATVIFFIL